MGNASGLSACRPTTGDCTGAIGNGAPAARQIPAPRASSCGLPLEGVLVQSATYNLVADCQMTGTLYIPKDLTVTINGNGCETPSAATTATGYSK